MKESLSPYVGKYDEVIDKLNGDYDGSLAVLIAAQPDYDADKQKPYLGQRAESKEEDEDMYHIFRDYNAMSEDVAEYPRRLEDIDSSHISAYLYNVLYGIRNNASNSIKSYNRENPTARTLLGNDEEYVEEKELLLDTDDDEYSQYEIQEAKNKVPYLIRRLHDKSIELGVHLISLIKAYERAKDVVQIGNLNRKNSITVKPHHILEEGVYSMSPDGSIGAMFDIDANKNSRAFMRGREWLYEDSETRSDANELIHCYEILGIDIKQEDPTIYTQEFVDRLVISYVTSNADYVMRKHDSEKQKKYSTFGFMRNIDQQLKDLPLEACEEYSNVQAMSEEDTVYLAMRVYIDSPNFADEDRYRLEYMTQQRQEEVDRACKLFIQYYNQINHTSIDIDRYYCCDGFFYTKGGSPFVLDMTGFIKDPKYSTFCLLNCNGYLVTCTYEIRTQYCDIFDMCCHLDNYLVGAESAEMRWKDLSL